MTDGGGDDDRDVDRRDDSRSDDATEQPTDDGDAGRDDRSPSPADGADGDGNDAGTGPDQPRDAPAPGGPERDATDPPATGPPSADDHPRGPPPHRRADDEVPGPTERPVRWLLRTDHALVVAARDVVTSVLLVVMVGLALFAVSGVWPPLVAIESGSMEENMHKGDLVIVVEEDRFASQLATEDGIVTRQRGEEIGHSQFGEPGSVIVYRPDGENRTPIIHRAVYFAERGEDWTEAVDPRYLRGRECADVETCPAEWDGYITRGDANDAYDQIGDQSDVVHPDWIEGRAVSRVPYLGCLRLELTGEGCEFGR